MKIITRLRRKIEAGDYVFSDHTVFDKLDGLGLERADLLHAIAKGWVERRMTNDARGPRYCVIGPALDGQTHLEIPCRFDDTGVVVLITVYEVEVGDEDDEE